MITTPLHPANCKRADPSLGVKVEESEFPVESGEEVTYSCSNDHVETSGKVKVVCEDGKIIISPKETTVCQRIGE